MFWSGLVGVVLFGALTKDYSWCLWLAILSGAIMIGGIFMD